MVPIPTNIPLLLGKDSWKDQTITEILKSDPNSEEDLKKNLVALTQHWKVKVWFSEPMVIPSRTGGYKTTDCHTFVRFFIGQSGEQLCFTHARTNRRGYRVPHILPKITRYEPVISKAGEFKSYEEFRKKFDTLFISEKEILDLWNGKSGQHGGKYSRHDFRKLGSEGQRVMGRFLTHFKGIPNQSGEGYWSKTFDDKPYLREDYKSYGNNNFGRDITISHTAGCEYVHYASEYPGCGNGRYGLIVNKNTFLHLEDD